MKRIGETPARGVPRALPTILYVEDEEENWTVAELRLRGRFHLVRASTDQEACQAVRDHGHSLHAVLMDIQLKGSQLDGIKLCRLFRGALEDPALPPYARGCPTITAPIIFVTAYGQRYTEAELRGVGGHMLITKPVDFNRIPLRAPGVA
jgi:CheY-like chemotaxis protein